MLPKLKYLVITESLIERNNFLRILESCKDLVHLDVSYCEGFREDNEEILKLTSHIDTFICEGCQNIFEDGTVTRSPFMMMTNVILIMSPFTMMIHERDLDYLDFDCCSDSLFLEIF